jgi:SAM-dependent methyltransferase
MMKGRRPMSTGNLFHLSTAAAELYESRKVPSVFGPLAKATFEAITLPADARVLDVACGTGVIPKLLTERLPGKGRIAGTDLNPAMVEIARRTMPETQHRVDWFSCSVTELPFQDGEFDIAFCQQGLQFFPDKPGALAEIARVLGANGKLFLTCWRAISPLFQAVSNSLAKRVSEKAAKLALDPFSFRDGDAIAFLLTGAGFRISEASSLVVYRPLTPARSAIRQEILASPYESDLLEKGEATIDAVVADVDSELGSYRQGETLLIPQESHLFQAEKVDVR